MTHQEKLMSIFIEERDKFAVGFAEFIGTEYKQDVTSPLIGNEYFERGGPMNQQSLTIPELLVLYKESFNPEGAQRETSPA